MNLDHDIETQPTGSLQQPGVPRNLSPLYAFGDRVFTSINSKCADIFPNLYYRLPTISTRPSVHFTNVLVFLLLFSSGYLLTTEVKGIFHGTNCLPSAAVAGDDVHRTAQFLLAANYDNPEQAAAFLLKTLEAVYAPGTAAHAPVVANADASSSSAPIDPDEAEGAPFDPDVCPPSPAREPFPSPPPPPACPD
eukprot:1176364-Prorocentrum_minimum.AAC.2